MKNADVEKRFEMVEKSVEVVKRKFPINFIDSVPTLAIDQSSFFIF